MTIDEMGRKLEKLELKINGSKVVQKERLRVALATGESSKKQLEIADQIVIVMDGRNEEAKVVLIKATKTTRTKMEAYDVDINSLTRTQLQTRLRNLSLKISDKVPSLRTRLRTALEKNHSETEKQILMNWRKTRECPNVTISLV